MASSSNKAGNAAEIDRLALVLAKEPGSKVFIPLAEEYGKAGMWQEAAAVLEDGLKTYPNFITAMVALGRAYDQLNQPVKAKAVLEEAVKLSPDNLRAHRTLAKIYVAQGAKEAALRSCDVILAVNPHDQEALSLRGALAPSDTRTHQAEPARREEPANQARTNPAQPASAGWEHNNPEGHATPSAAAIGEPLHAGGSSAPSTGENRQAVAARLEQWLASIQARRRDRSPGSGARPL
jgi:tetratricopeptide (TPR) repeat protein